MIEEDEGRINLSRYTVVVITGASSGIGYSIVQELLNRNGAEDTNYFIFGCARNVSKLDDLAKAHGPTAPGQHRLVPFRLDVSKLDSIEEFRRFLLSEYSHVKVDILYNNAGQACTVPVLDMTSDYVEDCFKVNVFGPITLCRELSGLIVACQGTIVFTGSVAGLVSIPYITVYSATKAAIMAYARGLHLEMRPFDVRVINFITGGVATNIGDTRPLPSGSLYNEDNSESNIISAVQSFNSRRRATAKQTSSADYARQVVRDITRIRNRGRSSNRSFEIYRGRYSRWVALVYYYLPHAIVWRAIYWLMGLRNLETALRDRKTASQSSSSSSSS